MQGSFRQWQSNAWQNNGGVRATARTGAGRFHNFDRSLRVLLQARQAVSARTDRRKTPPFPRAAEKNWSRNTKRASAKRQATTFRMIPWSSSRGGYCGGYGSWTAGKAVTYRPAWKNHRPAGYRRKRRADGLWQYRRKFRDGSLLHARPEFR